MPLLTGFFHTFNGIPTFARYTNRRTKEQLQGVRDSPHQLYTQRYSVLEALGSDGSGASSILGDSGQRDQASGTQSLPLIALMLAEGADSAQYACGELVYLPDREG